MDSQPNLTTAWYNYKSHEKFKKFRNNHVKNETEFGVDFVQFLCEHFMKKTTSRDVKKCSFIFEWLFLAFLYAN